MEGVLRVRIGVDILADCGMFHVQLKGRSWLELILPCLEREVITRDLIMARSPHGVDRKSEKIWKAACERVATLPRKTMSSMEGTLNIGYVYKNV